MLTNSLPALSDPDNCTSRYVSLHLAALHSARKAYIASESSKKIQLVLSKQTRPSGTVYNIGDKVFYKQDDDPRWRGPVTVLGHDNCVVFLRHGSRYIKAHVCRVMHAKESELIAQPAPPCETRNSDSEQNKKF